MYMCIYFTYKTMLKSKENCFSNSDMLRGINIPTSMFGLLSLKSVLRTYLFYDLIDPGLDKDSLLLHC